MFDRLTIHGRAAAILWGYRPAVTLRAWAITKGLDGQWLLTGTIERVDAYQCRQRPLLFTAPREGAHDGFWSWGIDALTVEGATVRARLGPPEQ